MLGDWLLLVGVIVGVIVLVAASFRVVDQAIARMPLGDLTDDEDVSL